MKRIFYYLICLIVIGCNNPSASNVEASSSEHTVAKHKTALEQITNWVEKNKGKENTEICSVEIQHLQKIFSENSYQEDVLQIIDVLKEVPNIKQCESWKNISDILGTAEGYKSLKWGMSLDNVKKIMGKMYLTMHSGDSFRDDDEWDLRGEILGSLPTDPFFYGRRWDSWSEENAERREGDEGKISTRELPMYAQGDKRFLFYNKKLFAYYENLPFSDDYDVYLNALKQKYGISKEECRGWRLCTRLNMWTFGNTYIVLNGGYKVIYVDKKVLDDLNDKYVETQTALKENERLKNERRRQQAQNVADSL